MKSAPMFFTLALAATAVATPTVSNVAVSPDPLSSGVKVTYKVSEDAVVTVRFFSDGVAIPDEGVTQLVGDICRKVPATADGEVRAFHWAPDLETWPTPRRFGKISAEVTAWATNAPPLFMAVDLVTKSNILYYASKAALPGGISNELYKTSKMLFRKIPAKEVVWNMDCSAKTDSAQALNTHQVVFSDDYYMAVYPCTQKQSLYIVNHRGYAFTDKADSDLRPCAGIDYASILGNGTTQTPISGNYRVSNLIKMSGNPTFNLPTEAEWEYACRARTNTMWYNGNNWNNASLIGWFQVGETKPVGMKAPNAWDLYDMTGNVFEYCLDWYAAYEFADKDVPVRDPLQKAQPENNKRVYRGGSYSNNRDKRFGNSGWRTSVSNTSADYENGFRLKCAAIAY